MIEPIKTFLIIPIYGAPLRTSDDVAARVHWPPNKEITGWQNQVTGQLFKHNSDAPVGAMWHACWLPPNWTWVNEVSPHLHVRCPNGPMEASGRFTSTRDWDIDSRASNCTLPEDKTHRCWIRHGYPPDVHVDKAGVTCAAGAGSILLPNWHGYLDKGFLVENRR